MRVGIGYDIHQLVSGRKLVLGGVTIPFEKGLLGHSDADVLLHAVCDAILGAAALGDIGRHFPDSSDEFKDISSIVLLEKTYEMIKKKGLKVVNVDATIFAQVPKLYPFHTRMEENIAQIIECGINQINIKATTAEGLGPVGRKEGIAAVCVVLLSPREYVGNGENE
jgi:2-C-methyl-D-erythritol 2,4-cyclodiphosphate synthase